MWVCPVWTLGPPAIGVLCRFFFGLGGFPYKNRLEKKVGSIHSVCVCGQNGSPPKVKPTSGDSQMG